MASAQVNDIKARIKSVNGTMQITKAMELVATSKLRNLKERAERSKPYLKVLEDAIRDASGFLSGSGTLYTTAREGKTLYILIAGDRGLAGGYNGNVIKLAASLDKENAGIYVPLGKKAYEAIHRRGLETLTDTVQAVADVGVGSCMKLAEVITEKYLDGSFTEVYLVYTRFASMLSQIPVSKKLLPLEIPEGTVATEPIFEGEEDELIAKIVPQYIGGILHAAICESAASECAARRSAMNSANKNAEEMINSLTLSFNRARQAVITQEITEIVSGAEAL